ncbi:hypothetical protein [Sphingomonas sp.]|uniref:hypothetical protein n=1 Tax=Sphingomonas sp. TaxID=28214 RepID=UPI003B3BA3CF
MPSSEPRPTAGASERRLRWIALASLLVLVPATVAATGWRDLREIRRTQELDAIDVPQGQTVAYAGAKVQLVGLNAIPFEPGLPKDRTFLRARLTVEPQGEATSWLGCEIQVTDGAGHAWTAIETVPDLVKTMLAKPGDAPGTICDGTSISAAEPGQKVIVDAYYLVPRPIPELRVRMSNLAGRPAYLQFAASKTQ